MAKAGEVFDRQLPAPGGLQVAGEALAQVDQVMRIDAGVIEQVAGEGALTPVGALVAFIDADAELGFEDGAQAEGIAA